MPEDYRNLAEYAKTRANPYGVCYEAICREVMGTKQRNQLRRLIGFRFTRHPSINLPEDRLTAIEKQIDLDPRVRELLSLPRAKKEQKREQSKVVLWIVLKDDKSPHIESIFGAGARAFFVYTALKKQGEKTGVWDANLRYVAFFFLAGVNTHPHNDACGGCEFYGKKQGLKVM